jgi:DNA-binding MarR family transcriptional regulator
MGNSGWTKIDNAALCDKRLSATEFRLWCALLSFDWAADTAGQQRRKKGVVWPSQTTLAEKLGVSRSTVQRSLEGLVALGYVVRVAGSGGGQLRAGGGRWYRNAYRLCGIDGASN